MKRKLIPVVIAIIILTLPGCISVNIDASKNTVIGKGEMIKRPYDVGSFNSVEIHGDFELIYRNSQSCNVELEMQENLFDQVNVSVERGNLIIDVNANLKTGNNQNLKIYAHAPELNQLILNGAVTLNDADIFTGERLYINVSGVCTIDAEVDVEKLQADVSGAGHIKLNGTAENAFLNLSGVANLDGIELKTAFADVIMSGTGNGSISCSDKLDIVISGIGSFSYKGNPEINKTISGLGALKQI